jgi:uncharacterized protein (TIRG00374 family)
LKKHHIGMILLVLAALAGFVFYRWRTSGFSWSKFLEALQGLDWSWMALALALVLATYAGRALRWEVMLRPLTRQASLPRILSATIIGFTAIVLFGRAGEPVRPYLIARKEGVSFSSQLAAWVLERLLDLLMILVIFGLALSQVAHSNIPASPRIHAILQAGGYTAGVTGLICLILLVAVRQFQGHVRERLMGALEFLPAPLHARVEKFLASFEEGMQATRSGSSVWMLLIYTAIEWAVIAAAFYCVFRAFPATSGFQVNDVVIVLGFVAFGSVVQIPGIGGGMQIATALALTEFYGLTLEAASGIALILWLVNSVSIVPAGLALAFHEGLRWGNLRHIDPSAGESRS